MPTISHSVNIQHMENLDKNPKVSVIICAWNEEKYIGRCLQSLLEQSFTDYEILFVDDGSTDKTLAIAKHISSSDNKLRVLPKIHNGFFDSCNFGAKNARGEILLFDAADHRYGRDYIKNVVQPIIEGGAIASNYAGAKVGNIDNPYALGWEIHLYPKPKVFGPIKTVRAIKTEIFWQLGGYDPSGAYFADIEFAERLPAKPITVYNVDMYHFRPDSAKEVFVHSRWIGRSLMLKPLGRKTLLQLLVRFLILLILCLVLIKNPWLAVLVSLFAFVLLQSLHKIVRASWHRGFQVKFLIMPVFYSLYYSGLATGASQQLKNKLFSKKIVLGES